MAEYIDYDYRVWDNEADGWYEKKVYDTLQEAQNVVAYLEANGWESLEIREQEIRWKTYAEVPVPDAEVGVR